jgi:hypothetical protein
MAEYPNLPFIVALYDIWSLKDNREDREPCRYINKDGESTFEQSEAFQVSDPEAVGALIAKHMKVSIGENYYYKPQLLSRTMEEHKTLREWHGANQS